MKKITKRESEVLTLIAAEYTMKEIASLLYVSEETIKSHRKNLFEKLQVKNGPGLIRKAFELGIFSVPSAA